MSQDSRDGKELPSSEISSAIAAAISVGMKKVLDEADNRSPNTVLEAARRQNENLVKINQDLMNRMENLSQNLSLLGTSGSGVNWTMTTMTSTKESATTTLSVFDGLAWKNFRANFKIVHQLNKWDDARAFLKLRAAPREDAHRAI